MNDWQKYFSVFLVSLGICTLFVNNLNAKSFGLQNAGIESIVERGTVYLDGSSIPEFIPSGDTFRYQDRSYAMKQPGQFFLGAVVYYPLYLINWRFMNHYDYVSHIITFFTSGFMVALIATILYLISHSWWGPLVLLSTIILPYSGVTHHDVIATGVLSIAWFLTIRKQYFVSGIMAGLVLFFSMLPLTSTLAILIAIWLASRSWKLTWQYMLGFGIGLLPSLIFNYLNFANPLLFPNLAGKVSDTIPLLDINNLFTHLYFYLLDPKTSLFFFSPILVFAIFGLKIVFAKSRFLGYLVVVAPILLILHVSMQETFGGYQYGPRYLLPIIPLLAVSAAIAWRELLSIARTIFLVLFVYSLIVALIGAMTTVMYPMPNTPYAPFAQLTLLFAEPPRYRMMPLGFLLIVIGLLFGLAGLKRALKHVNPVGRLDQ